MAAVPREIPSRRLSPNGERLEYVTQVRLPRELHQALHVEADQVNSGPSDVIRTALYFWLRARQPEIVSEWPEVWVNSQGDQEDDLGPDYPGLTSDP